MKSIMAWDMKEIKRLRKKRGMSIRDMAKELKITRQAIYYYFNNTPSVHTVLQVANALKVSWKDLIK
jgi:transcriptional regulator with XRE-family HTH domain